MKRPTIVFLAFVTAASVGVGLLSSSISENSGQESQSIETTEDYALALVETVNAQSEKEDRKAEDLVFEFPNIFDVFRSLF